MNTNVHRGIGSGNACFTQTVLVINPGSTSTKIAVYRGKERLLSENISHSADQLEKYPIIVDQYGFRSEAVQNTLLLKWV